jgi:hypothetical protein
LVIFFKSNAMVLFPKFFASLWHASPLLATANSLKTAVKFISSTSIWSLVDARFGPIASKFTSASSIGVLSTDAFVAPGWEKFAFVVLVGKLVGTDSNWNVVEEIADTFDWSFFTDSFWATGTDWSPFAGLDLAGTASWSSAAKWITFAPGSLATFLTTFSSGWSFIFNNLFEAFSGVTSNLIKSKMSIAVTLSLFDNVSAGLVDAVLLPAASVQVFITAFNFISSTGSWWADTVLEGISFVHHSLSFGFSGTLFALLVVAVFWKVVKLNIPSTVKWNNVVFIVPTGKFDDLFFTSWATLDARVKFSLSWPNEFIALIRASKWLTFVWSTLTDQLLATAIMFDHDSFFFVSTTFSFWTNGISAAIWNTFVFEAAIIDLVAHKVFVEAALWDFFAIPIKALDGVNIATRTDPADVAFVIPRFTENTWTFFIHTGGLWGSWWGNWWWSITTNVFDAFVFDTTWRWLWVRVFEDKTSWASWLDVLGLVRVLALVVVALAFVSWTVTFVFTVHNSHKFVTFFNRTFSFIEFTSRLIALVWDTLKNLFAAFVFVNKSSDFSKTSFTAVWEGWSWASDWAAVFSKVGLAKTDLTFIEWASLVLPWGGTWTNDDSVGFGSAAVVLDLGVNSDLLSLAIADTFDLLAFLGWMLPFSIDWLDLTIMIFTAADAAVFVFFLDRTSSSTVVLFTEVDAVVWMIPFSVNWNFLAVLHTAVDAARFSPPSWGTVGAAVFFLAFISWVIPDLVIDVNSVSKSGTITILSATDDAARIMEAWFPLPSGLASRVADKFVTWIGWIVPGSVDSNFDVFVVEATSKSWNTLVIETTWFISRSSWVLVLEFHAVTAGLLWTAWIVVATVIIAFAVMSWTLAFWISWVWSGGKPLAFVDFTGLAVRASFTGLAFILSATADNLSATLVVFISETVLWGLANWTAVWEAWLWAFPVDDFDLTGSGTFVLLARFGFVVKDSVESDLVTLWVNTTADTAFSFVFDATWAVGRSSWVFVDETVASWWSWFWTTWVVITTSIVADAFFSAATAFIVSIWGVFNDKTFGRITRFSWTVVAFFADLPIAAHGDLFTALIIINKALDWSSTVFAAVREAWSLAFDWFWFSLTSAQAPQPLAFVGWMSHESILSNFLVEDSVPTTIKATGFVPWLEFTVVNAMHFFAGFGWMLIKVIDVNNSAISMPFTTSDLTDNWNFFNLTFRHTFELNISLGWVGMWPGGTDWFDLDEVAVFIFSFATVNGATIRRTRADIAAAVVIFRNTAVAASWTSLSETKFFHNVETFLDITLTRPDHAAVVNWIWNIIRELPISTLDVANIVSMDGTIVVAASFFGTAVAALISTRTWVTVVFILEPGNAVAPLDTVDVEAAVFTSSESKIFNALLLDTAAFSSFFNSVTTALAIEWILFWTVANFDASLGWPGTLESDTFDDEAVFFNTTDNFVDWVASTDWIIWNWNVWTLWLDAFTVGAAFKSFRQLAGVHLSVDFISSTILFSKVEFPFTDFLPGVSWALDWGLVNLLVVNTFVFSTSIIRVPLITDLLFRLFTNLNVESGPTFTPSDNVVTLEPKVDTFFTLDLSVPISPDFDRVDHITLNHVFNLTRFFFLAPRSADLLFGPAVLPDGTFWTFVSSASFCWFSTWAV